MEKVILLADDDIDDVELFVEALELIDGTIVCHCANNGREAIDLLHSLERKPEVIFLDINMPIMGGWEVLILLKGDPRYKDIPVIIVSTSSHRKDIETAETMGALCYFVKPNNFNDLKKILEEITANLGEDLAAALGKLQREGFKQLFCGG